MILKNLFIKKTMKRILIIGLFLSLAGLLSSNSGCNVNPVSEVPTTSYGKVVDKLPDIPEAQKRYSYPDYVNLRHIPK